MDFFLDKRESYFVIYRLKLLLKGWLLKKSAGECYNIVHGGMNMMKKYVAVVLMVVLVCSVASFALAKTTFKLAHVYNPDHAWDFSPALLDSVFI